jgi:hypothetical protein
MQSPQASNRAYIIGAIIAALGLVVAAIISTRSTIQVNFVVATNEALVGQVTEEAATRQTIQDTLAAPTSTFPPTGTSQPALPSFTPTLLPTSPSTPTPLLIPGEALGEGQVILSNREDNIYTWNEGSPYITTQFVDEGDVAFIPTGNNQFSKELGVIGYEQDEFRYITFKLYLLKQDAALLLQVRTSMSGWEHRWGFDGRSTYEGRYGWARKGDNANLPVGQWFDVQLDLIDQLGVRPGEKLVGLAFSGTDGNMMFDDVTLVSDH